MIVKEYRVIVPFNVDDFQRGHLYTTAEMSKAETGGGEGVEVIKQESFESNDLRPGETLEGIYTYKIYRLKSKMPWIVQKMFPDAAFDLHEESWNAYPYFKTVITNPGYMKKDFKLIIESYHKEGPGDEENVLNTPDTKREIIMLDIYDEAHLKKTDITEQNDPRRIHSEKADIGPLEADWQNSEETPVMCAYKLVSITFNWRGFGSRIEKMAHTHYPRIFTKFHREVFALTDLWWDLTLDEVREHEEQTAADLREMLKEKNKRGSYQAENSDREKNKK